MNEPFKIGVVLLLISLNCVWKSKVDADQANDNDVDAQINGLEDSEGQKNDYQLVTPNSETLITIDDYTTSNPTEVEEISTTAPSSLGTSSSPCDGVPAFQYVNMRQTNSEIHVNWLPEMKYTSCNLEYRLWSNGTDTNEKVLKNATRYTIYNLNSCTLYVISIGINSNGHNGRPVVRKIRTLPNELHRVRINVLENMVNISWDKSKDSRCNQFDILIGDERYATKIKTNSYLINEKDVFCKDLGVQYVDDDDNFNGEAFYGQVAGKVRNLSVKNRNESAITIVWDPPDEDSCILGYRIVRNNEKPIYIHETTYTFPTTVSNVRQCHSNDIRVATLSNSNHLGEAAALNYEIRNVPDDDVGPVTNVSVKEENHILTVTWSPPADFENCPFRYRICTSFECVFVNDTSYRAFNQIVPCYPYEIFINVLLGEKSVSEYQTNHTGQVYDIEDVEEFSLFEDEGKLKATWKKPEDLQTCDVRYELEWEQRTVNETNESYNFGEIVPCHNYTVGIRACINAKCGDNIEATHVGNVAAIHQVRDFQMNEDGNVLVLRWEKPDSLDECKLNYILVVNGMILNTGEEQQKIEEVIPCKTYDGSLIAVYSEISGDPYSINYTAKAKPLVSPKSISMKVSASVADLTWEVQPHEENLCEGKVLRVRCNGKNMDGNNCPLTNDTIAETMNGNEIIVTKLQVSAYGNYTCEAFAENVAGSSPGARVSFLTNAAAPPSPIIHDPEVSSDSISIKWLMDECVWGKLTEYVVTASLRKPLYFIPSECPVPSYNVSESTMASQYRFANVSAYSEYEIIIVAKTNGGSSFTNVNVTTLPGLSENVTEITCEANRDAENLNKFILNLNWNHPCNTNGPIQFVIKLQGKSYAENLSYFDKEINVNKTSDNYSEIIDVLPAYDYNLTIADEKMNQLADVLMFQTDEGVPEEPRNMSILETMANGFVLDWDPPLPINGRLTQYVINILAIGPRYNYLCEYQKEFRYDIGAMNDNVFHFTGGQAYFDYECTVTAYTQIGAGKSRRVNVTTNATNPDPVDDFKYKLITNYSETYDASIQVTISEPCNINGDLDVYVIELKGTRNDQQHYEKNETLDTGTLIELKPEYDYVVTVRVKNKQGCASAIKEKAFRSPPGIPPEIEGNLNEPTASDDNPYILNFVLDKSLIREDNGHITYYSLILTRFVNEEQPFGRWANTTASSFTITKPFWNPFNGTNATLYTYQIGTGEQGKDFHNYALSPDTEYHLKVRYFTSQTYRDSATLKFTTEKLRYNTLMVLIITFVTLFVMILMIFIYVKFKKQNFLGAKYSSGNRQEDITLDSLTSFTVKQLPLHYADLRENPLKLKAEYTRLIFEPGSTVIANMPINKKKNRYVDILPYDDTRVPLKHCDNGNDYINASYIKGYSSHVEYIASQGPLGHTIFNFWNLIIQENVTVIVMLTQFVEANKIKCHKYIPNNHENMEFDDGLEIRCANELNFGTYISRTLHVQKDTSKWTIKHLQFVDWPDFGCPKDTRSLLEFCCTFRELMKKSGGLALVHCSAGVGRTGTLIALDILLQTMNDNKDINVYQTVFNLRKQRMKMVQTEAQYMFIYTCLNDIIETPLEINDDKDNMNDPIYENIENCH